MNDSASAQLSYHLGQISEKTYVHYQLIWQGKDLMIVISGGVSHIGSIAHSDKKGKTIHQFTFPEHREDEIVRQTVENLSDVLEGELLVIGGMHYDDITRDQIRIITHHCTSLIERIRRDLQGL